MTDPQPDKEQTPPQPADSGAMDGQTLTSGAVVADKEWLDSPVVSALFWMLWQCTDRSMIDLTADEKIIEFVKKTEVALQQQHEAEVLEARISELNLSSDPDVDIRSRDDLLEWNIRRSKHLTAQLVAVRKEET